ncbi:DMT family transporter [Photobacterium sp.]|uniref:DMT family transporter n=1 Tax=Photobacterium sp. TaxID=660 RepID=UPI00299CF655|nr:DMT family transporter [Photobacterium sp.]MDX1304669.1 DMT family transporter [Photobacterium sp.]
MITVLYKKLQTIGYTITALIAFAANSVLCRIALKDNAIDASSFTAIRLLSGVLMFLILFSLKAKSVTSTSEKKGSSWITGLMLFIYAVTFSFAYISLDTGTGALVLFGAVQLTMIIGSIAMGKKLHISEWLGIGISFSGLAYLVYPTLTTPSLSGFVLMGLSGIAWGIYTLVGRGSADPMTDTAFNFKFTILLVLCLSLITFPMINISFDGVVLAAISGAFASALGYTIWYMALGGLSETEAAVVQLSVPVIAAIGGVLFVSESISTRLIIACILVLGGILTVLIGRWKFANK